ETLYARLAMNSSKPLNTELSRLTISAALASRHMSPNPTMTLNITVADENVFGGTGLPSFNSPETYAPPSLARGTERRSSCRSR
ncbi:hypothetical protein PENTCL1PPCAC_16665, partial [Pristionchus entomophagus]